MYSEMASQYIYIYVFLSSNLSSMINIPEKKVQKVQK